MIQPLLTVAEMRSELAATETSLRNVMGSSGCVVDPDARQARVLRLQWWRGRQLRQIAEMETQA